MYDTSTLRRMLHCGFTLLTVHIYNLFLHINDCEVRMRFIPAWFSLACRMLASLQRHCMLLGNAESSSSLCLIFFLVLVAGGLGPGIAQCASVGFLTNQGISLGVTLIMQFHDDSSNALQCLLVTPRCYPVSFYPIKWKLFKVTYIMRSR